MSETFHETIGKFYQIKQLACFCSTKCPRSTVGIKGLPAVSSAAAGGKVSGITEEVSGVFPYVGPGSVGLQAGRPFLSQ